MSTVTDERPITKPRTRANTPCGLRLRSHDAVVKHVLGCLMCRAWYAVRGERW